MVDRPPIAQSWVVHAIENAIREWKGSIFFIVCKYITDTLRSICRQNAYSRGLHYIYHV